MVDFNNIPFVDKDTIVGLLHDLLRMTYLDRFHLVTTSKGAHVCLKTLHEIYEDRLEKGNIEEVGEHICYILIVVLRLLVRVAVM